MVLVLITIFLPVTGVDSAIAYTHSMEAIADGGPYRAKRKRIERFAGKFKLEAQDVHKPMVLTLHNGFSEKPGFNWLRVFLCGDINIRNFDRYEEPHGDLIFDENYVQMHTISLDITDLVKEGVNTVYIEGKGPGGAVLSWTLNGAVSPEFSPINPSLTHQGARLTLTGRGFSHDLDENIVYAGDQKLKVLSASRGRLTVEIPFSLNPGKVSLKASVNGVPSEPFSILVKATPKVVSLKPVTGSGRELVIGGSNLSGPIDKTEVYFGNFKAQVIQVQEDQITVTLPPELFSSGKENLTVNVQVDGVQAAGNLVYSVE